MKSQHLDLAPPNAGIALRFIASLRCAEPFDMESNGSRVPIREQEFLVVRISLPILRSVAMPRC
jgi:hypothetical protein